MKKDLSQRATDPVALKKVMEGIKDGVIFSGMDILESIRADAERERLALKAQKEEEKRKEKEERDALKKKEEAEIAERVKKATCTDLPMDFENAFWGDDRVEGVQVDSVYDGLVLSLTTLGKVDIEYISSVTGEEMKNVISKLKGHIYQNPETWEDCFYKGWETADEYLSGNLKYKWKKAYEANKIFKGWFSQNLKALKSLLPPAVATEDIYITLGSPWVPADIIDEFIEYLLGKSFCSGDEYSTVRHDPNTGSWEIPFKSRYYGSARSFSVYGSERMPALLIIENTLNMKSIAVYDEVPSLNPNSKTGVRRVINQQETAALLEKQQKIINMFEGWVWRDEKRKARLEEIFENTFTSRVVRRYDGSFFTFPGLSEEISLYPYQKNAVARIIFSPNTLLSHDVGSGKTFVMICAGMELKRMRISNKNLYVVPNNIIGQWHSIFLRLYPNAKVLVVTPDDFTPTNKQNTLENIRDNDYDGIIMAYSCFDRIPLSDKYYEEKAREDLSEIEYNLKSSQVTPVVERERKKLKEEVRSYIDKVRNQVRKTEITFDELGITRLFIDEAHNYKNVPIKTMTTCVLGISSSGSQKCQDAMDKVRHVQKTNGGGGVVMATGTPITNSITDIYVMQSYLQSGELALLDLQSFDAWIGMFAEKKTEFEIDVDTSKYRLATRFSKFHNLPELTSLIASFADFHRTGISEDLPNFNGYTDTTIPRTPLFEEYLKDISRRADVVRNGKIKREEDNMLKITGDGRKAALDLRLVNPNAEFSVFSKCMACSEKVMEIYHKTADENSAQVIFCDSSTPKPEFNMYAEMKRLLVMQGALENQIAFIHDYNTEAKRERLFAKVREGKVRILLGSTFKLGLGVNVQDRLIALHHLDIPWRPADMVQREGRIIRQGNLNKEVFIYRYITEGSFDAYSWQLLESKQHFISSLLSGAIEKRSGSDISDIVLNYAEVKALAIGNPLIKQRVEVANEIKRLYALKRRFVADREELMRRKSEIPIRKKNIEDKIEKCKRDIAFYMENKREYDKEEKRSLRTLIYESATQPIMNTEEIYVCDYQGFEVILPIGLAHGKPRVLLVKNGRYEVEMGDGESGVLIRFDNCLEKLPNDIIDYAKKIEGLNEEEKHIDEALEKEENYDERITEQTEKLERLDRELGVDIDE